MTSEEEPEATAQLIGLTRVFTPAQAAGILRNIGLDEMTECALRTRAYRKQIPFHLNGHRIIFTIDDLREIAEGKPFRPAQRADATEESAATLVPRPARRRPRRDQQPAPSDAWRARRPRNA